MPKIFNSLIRCYHIKTEREKEIEVYAIGQGAGEMILFSPNFPRFGWKFIGTHFFWYVGEKEWLEEVGNIAKALKSEDTVSTS